MAASWQQGYDVSSGSGATGWQEDEWNYEETYSSFNMGSNPSADVSTSPQGGAPGDHVFASAELFDDEVLDQTTLSATYGSSELPHGALMSPKIPPAFSGRESWFAYEELIDDWVDSCTLEPKLRGPALKNRLYGEAAAYKPMLDRNALKDEDTGVEYFVKFLRPHFIKGVQTVFFMASVSIYETSSRALGDHSLDPQVHSHAKTSA